MVVPWSKRHQNVMTQPSAKAQSMRVVVKRSRRERYVAGVKGCQEDVGVVWVA